MTFNENQEPMIKSVDLLFEELESPEKSYSHQLKKIEYAFNGASPENIQLVTSLINDICSKDEWIKRNWWDFLKTLEKVELGTV